MTILWSPPRAILVDRPVSAAAASMWSGLNLDVQVTYAAELHDRTWMQRRIEQTVRLPSPAWRLRLGGLEFFYEDGVRLSEINYYGCFTEGAMAQPPVVVDAPAAFLTFPCLDLSEDDAFGIDVQVLAHVDSASGWVRFILDQAQPWATCALADGLFLSVDDAGCVMGLAVSGVVCAGPD